MGGCISVVSYEDEDDKIIKHKNKQHAREMQEFQKQLRLQKGFSELDINGKGISKKKK